LKAYIIDALKHYKNDVFFNKILGILLFREKNYSEALSVFNAIPKNKNIDIDILSFKGLCLFHLKEYDKSIQVFKNILQLDRKKISSYYYIGLSYDNIKDYKSALYYYNVFIKYGGNEKNFKHINWIRNRVILLERSEMN
jgi:tetratricopeptide (TPR) repeat protein